MIDMEVAIHHGADVGQGDASLRQDLWEATGSRLVVRVEYRVAKAEARVEEQEPVAMTHDVGHHDALLTGERLVIGETESRHLERDDLWQVGDDHRPIRARRSGWRRGRDSNPRWVAPNRISSAAP